VLSKGFVTSKWPMKELLWFLKRLEEQPGCVSLIPVFLSLSFDECKPEALKQLYDATWADAPDGKPDEAELTIWIEAIDKLRTFIGVKLETVSL
jgi:hypothetical protein